MLDRIAIPSALFFAAALACAGCGGESGDGGSRIEPPPAGNPVGGTEFTPLGVPSAPGTVSTVAVTNLPGAGTVASSWDDFILPLGRANFSVPRGMYMAACDIDSANPRVFVSANVESASAEPIPDGQDGELGPLWQDYYWHGTLVEARYEPGMGLVPVRQVSQPDCIEMRGIVATPDCSVVAALCMKPNDGSLHPNFQGNGPSTRDLVAETEGLERHDRNGGTWPEELWLYEWTDGDIEGAPDRYVVHGSAGSSWHYMNYRLVLGDDGTYGILTKAYNGGHEGSSLLIMDRATHDFALDRSKLWGGCEGGAGHPMFGFLAYNPATSRYATHCGGDWDNDVHDPINVNLNGIQIEGVGRVPLYRTIANQRCCNMGAPGGIVPMEDGGYLLAFTAAPDEEDSRYIFEVERMDIHARTAAALMRVDANGEIVWGPRYVRYPEGGDRYGGWLTNATIADLGNGSYLFGYGRTGHEDPSVDYDADEFDFVGSRQAPFEYVLFEVDGDGNRLTEDLVTTDVGWGGQDELIHLGDGRVAWAYVPDPVRPLEGGGGLAISGQPPGNSSITEITLHVYESARP